MGVVPEGQLSGGRLGFRVKGLGLRVLNLGFKVSGFRFRVEGVVPEGQLSGGRRARGAAISRGKTVAGSHNYLIKSGRAVKVF